MNTLARQTLFGIKNCITTATKRRECRILSRPGSVEILEYKYRRHTDPNGRYDQNEIKRNERLNYFKVVWYPKMDQKDLFKYGEERPNVCYCTQEEKLNFESFTQNGCYGNQPQPPEVVFYSIDANRLTGFI